MDLTWNLDTLYTSFSSPKFKDDMELFSLQIDNLNKWVTRNLTDTKRASFKIEEFLKRYSEYKSLYTCLFSYGYLVINSDSTNLEAMDILDSIEDKASAVTEAFVKFNKWLNSLNNVDELIGTSLYLMEHSFYLKELLTQSKYLLHKDVESIISKMQITGSRAWQRAYMEHTSTVSMNLDIPEKTEPLSFSELNALAYNKDHSIRKKAYYALVEGCKRISQASAACINGISGEALTIYEMRGYKSTLEKVLISSRMDNETLNAMFSAIKESLPIFHKYYEKKAHVLGHRSSLPFYDIFAPVGDASTKISYTDARDLIVSSFNTFSDDLGDFAKKVFDERWIDAEPRVGKGNYGLCVDIFPIKESRILTTFTGDYSDVGILAHEIGHAYHSYCLRGEQILNTDYPTPIAETASIFCETIINNTVLHTMPRNEGTTILEKSISDVGYFIVDFYARYNFEVKLYERRKSGHLTVKELNELMYDCMVEAYGSSIDCETIHPYMWMNKVGYYLAGNEFLNFPYSFGVLFSKGLYAQYLKEGEAFVSQYTDFLCATSKSNIVDVAQSLNIDIHSIDFWRNALTLIENDIIEFINRV